jgi:hypothetical protein
MTVKASDGKAEERKAAATISIALCAESTHATLNEEAGKIDIKFSFNHAFNNTQLLTFHCQVKSGSSYNLAKSSDEIIKLKDSKGLITTFKNDIGIVVWVPPKPSKKIYWVSIDPRTEPSTPLQIPKYNFVRPSMCYDLSRSHSYSKFSVSTPRYDVGMFKGEIENHNISKMVYKKLKETEFLNPLTGKIFITRYGWRHVTRQSKTTKKRNKALRVVPYLKHFLAEIPNRFRQLEPSFRTEGTRTIETRRIKFWYRKALIIDGDIYTLLLRIKEVVKYPSYWKEYPLHISDIEQKATLESWWVIKEN